MKDYVRQYRPSADEEYRYSKSDRATGVFGLIPATFLVGSMMGASVTLLILELL
tara:strand:- start:6 stop:167 length:162 start_codon:yes stop_codon:yes gene_type:complete